MAQYLALKFAAETKDAVRNVGTFTKSLGRLMLGANKMTLMTRGLNTAFLGIGSTLVGTATTFGFMAAAVETAAFRSRLALDRVGVSATGLAKEFQASGRSATALLPVAARFARFGVVGDQLKAVTDVAFDMGFALEIGVEKAGEGLADIAGAMQIKTAPGVRRLASSLTMLQLNFRGTYDSNVQLLKTLGSTAHYLKMDESALLGANVAMQNVGISAGDAQGALGNILHIMAQSPEAAASLAMGLDMSGEQLQRFEGLDTAEQLRELFRVMAGKTPRDLAYRLEGIAGISDTTAFALANMAGETERLNEVFGIAVTTGDEVGEEAAIRAKTVGGALELLWGKMSALGSAAGDKTKPILVELIGLLSKVVDWISSWPPGILGATTSVIGLAGGILGLMGVLRILGTGIRFILGIGAAASGAAAGTGVLAASGSAAALTVGELMSAGYIATPAVAELGIAAGATGASIGGMEVAAATATPVVGGLGAAIGGLLLVAAPFIAVAGLTAGAIYGIMNHMGLLGDETEESIGTWNRFKDVVSKGFGALPETVMSIKRAIFGSSFLHLKEGVADVMPGLNKLGMSFETVGRAAGDANIEAQIPKPFEAAGRVRIETPRSADVDGRLPDPLNVMTATERALGAMMPALLGKQAFGGPAGSGSGVGGDMSSSTSAVGAAGAGERSVRIVVPVVVELEGHVLARATAEYDLDLGPERYMGAPVESMRATGG